MPRTGASWRNALVVAAFNYCTLAADILHTTDFNNCDQKTDIIVHDLNFDFIVGSKLLTFNISGTSAKEQNVMAKLDIEAYGHNVYSNSFDPCDSANFVQYLCPVPSGSFTAVGAQVIPGNFIDALPSIVYQIPDIAALATLRLTSKDSGNRVACIEAQVTNDKSTDIPAVSYVAAAVSCAAVLATAVSGIGTLLVNGGAVSGAHGVGGSGTISPTFSETFLWFQGMAINGMMSVNYPAIYRSFTKNFGFSAGLIPWHNMQLSIDEIRRRTGGNLTNDSVQFLENSDLVFPETLASEDHSASHVKRSLFSLAQLVTREIQSSINVMTSASSNTTDDTFKLGNAVNGIQAYAEQLSIPSANTFMTALLIVAIVIAVIVVSLLLVRVILESCAVFGRSPKCLSGFREHVWGTIARSITSLIFLLYGIWVLYCIFQLKHGDTSWAAKGLAALTLLIFTAVLAFFTFKIWRLAQKLKRDEGAATRLYEDKAIWLKYRLFYDSYRKDYWWMFVPVIIYMFVKGCCMAATDGHGVAQTILQFFVEAAMLSLFVWSQPFERKSGNVINIAIQVVRVLSVICVMLFLDEFGIAESTQTIAGVVLIVVQSILTVALGCLILWNAGIVCFKENPHRRRRKNLEKQIENDNQTSYVTGNSTLNGRSYADPETKVVLPAKCPTDLEKQDCEDPNVSLYQYENNSLNKASSDAQTRTCTMTTQTSVDRKNLMGHVAPLGWTDTIQTYPPGVGGYRGIQYSANPPAPTALSRHENKHHH